MMRALIVLIVPTVLLGCGNNPDHKKDPWLQHVPTAWKLTPEGHTRDAGPFASIDGDWLTDSDIDNAVDDAYKRFHVRFPGLLVGEYPITLNDDYAMWIPLDRRGNGAWAAGVCTTASGNIGVCLWSRAETVDEPGSAYIVRPPGVYWGVGYATWRHTGWPLCPAIVHELLHSVIGDPDHTSPLWANAN